jgi:hypothetical protein
VKHHIILDGGIHTHNRIPGPIGPGASGAREHFDLDEAEVLGKDIAS